MKVTGLFATPGSWRHRYGAGGYKIVAESEVKEEFVLSSKRSSMIG